MSKIKHVLVILLLVLPMFVLAPTLVASPNETLASPIKADTALPAAFVEETLRVAVYVENDVSLPAYAEGGVYTNYSGNVISFLEGAGYAVTPMTGPDILDHKLLAAKYDALVLPNNLPKDNVANLVKDYWLAGGGILSIGGTIGYLLYMGMIHPSLAGDFGLVGVGPIPYYWYDQPVANIEIQERHTIAQFYEDNEVIVVNDTVAVFDFNALSAMIDDGYTTVSTEYGPSPNGVIFALDSDYQGGKIVQIPGNCSTIPVWERPIITDAIDWLAPKPKGRILVDLSHNAYFSVDFWDEGGTAYYGEWRDVMVNHSYIVDKLHPSPDGNFTLANLNDYDMLFVPFPKLNFTAAEISAVTSWVNAGGGLFCIGERWFGTLIPHNQNLNYLLTNFDVSIYETGDTGDPIDFFDEHPTTEGCSTLYDNAYGFVNFTGDAKGVWRTDDVNYVSAVDTHGNGRIVLFADINWFASNHLTENSHLQYAINVANWLTAAQADVLFYVDNPTLIDPYYAPAVDALNDLGISYYITSNDYYMNLSLHEQAWSLVILDSPWPGIGGYLDDISSYLDTGGDLIVSWHQVGDYSDNPIFAKIGFESVTEFPDKQPFHIWNSNHGIFNYPNDYGALNFTPMVDYGDEGDLLTVFPNATALAGYTETNSPGNATTVLGFGGHVLFNAYLIDQLTGDLDDSTFADNFELWENQIAFMYYDRPSINQPDDVTYMETETGNEISWLPVADAGPWDYVIRENGSIVKAGQWDGGAITINVDGVNASITDYQLTVFDRLGYSASDVVVLNVTVYAATTPTGGGGAPLDPTLLLIVGAVAAVVILLIVVMVFKKKK